MKLLGVFSLVTMMILPFGSWAAGVDTPGPAEDDICNTNEAEGTKEEAVDLAPDSGGSDAADEAPVPAGAGSAPVVPPT